LHPTTLPRNIKNIDIPYRFWFWSRCNRCSLFKSFALSESRGSRLELSLETFNTWNRTQFNAIGTTFNGFNPSGQPNGNFGQVTSAFDPRILQLGGKIYF
jgi:hypothetical protein